MKILSIVGARPQFIKCAPLSRAIRKEHEEILVHTGQHYDSEMSQIFFDELNIPKPNYNLDIGSASHGKQTGHMLIEIEKVLLKEKPDLVIVYGDTNSTIAGSLAASKLHIPVSHVEAGLRSFDRNMPEEVNRVITDHVSNLLFCPTETAVMNLKNESITEGVHNVGDVMMDAVLYNSVIAEEKSTILEDLGLDVGHYILATIHRASNTDSKKALSSIMNAFIDSGEKIVFPVHPRTEKYMKHYNLWNIASEKLILTKPVGYLDMLKLTGNANKVFTDSGGLQKEAYIFDVPCVTLRENTEWTETVKAGLNSLVGADYQKIIDSFEEYDYSEKRKNIFGDGFASEKISNIISQHSTKIKSYYAL